MRRSTFGFSTLLGATSLLTTSAAANSVKNSVHMNMVPLSVNEAALEDKYTDTMAVSQEFIRS